MNSRDKFRDARGIFAERARIDDGIAGIVVYIADRRVDPLHAHGARFQRGDFAHGVRVFGIASGGQRHRRREGCAFIQAHGGAAFEIGADQQRQLGFGLQLIGEHRRGICLVFNDAERRAVRDVDEAADVQIVHVVHHLRVGLGIRGREAAVIRGEEQLADLFFQASSAVARIPPICSARQ